MRSLRTPNLHRAKIAPQKECGWKVAKNAERFLGPSAGPRNGICRDQQPSEITWKTILRGGSTLGLANPARQSAQNQALLYLFAFTTEPPGKGSESSGPGTHIAP